MAFWKKLGKGLKKAAKGIGKAASGGLLGAALDFVPGGSIIKGVMSPLGKTIDAAKKAAKHSKKGAVASPLSAAIEMAKPESIGMHVPPPSFRPKIMNFGNLTPKFQKKFNKLALKAGVDKE